MNFSKFADEEHAFYRTSPPTLFHRLIPINVANKFFDVVGKI